MEVCFYDVTVLSAPTEKTCSIAHNEGYVSGANVTDVNVVCSRDTYTVGGTALGLEDGETLVLQVNLDDDLAITTNSTFTFATPLADGSFYDVTVLTSPDEKHCSISNNEGYISGADITDVDVMCAREYYTVGGTVIGLDAGGSLVLQNNKDDDLTVTENGTFVFSAPIANGGYYDVTVFENHSGKTCSVTNGKSVVSGANVDNVIVVCDISFYTVGGNVTGFSAGDDLRLQNNGKDDLTITSDGAFTFTTALANGAGYSVSVLKEPSGKNCVVTNGNGTINGASITTVDITCNISPSPMLFATYFTMPSAALGGIAGADLHCDRDPSCPKFGTCKAMIVDGTNRRACSSSNCGTGGTSEHIDWVLQPNREYVRTDKATTIGTTTVNGVFTFPLQNAVTFEALHVWTGLFSDWQSAVYNCAKWEYGSSGSYGANGKSNVVDGNLIDYGAIIYCDDSSLHIYCVEQ